MVGKRYLQPARRAQPRRPTAAEDDASQALLLARIETLSRTARANWLGMLAYLVFFGITLLGVTDADLFVERLQTELPLVNVSIPTLDFFWSASALGMALHVYFHLHLLKLWDALGPENLPPLIDGAPAGQRVFPWLVTDFALRRRRDGATSGGKLGWLSSLSSLALVWFATPGLLSFAWWRSQPAHLDWLTFVISICVALSFTASIAGGVGMLRRMRKSVRRPGKVTAGIEVLTAVLILALFGSVGWMRTTGGWLENDAYQRRLGENIGVGMRPFDNNLSDAWPRLATYLQPYRNIRPFCAADPSPFCFDFQPFRLAPIDLHEVELVPVPDDWRDWEATREPAHRDWCGARGIPAAACGPAPLSTMIAHPKLASLRDIWCRETGIIADLPQTAPAPECAAHFAALDVAFLNDWRNVSRPAAREPLAPLDLQTRDLRGADLSSAFLAGSDLREARMEGANLSGASMEGANLSGARMEGADLSGASMEGADLHGARMEGADLRLTSMEGADLFRAKMDEANFFRARMEGAKLIFASLARADLRGARMEGANLFSANMQGVSLRGARLEGANLFRARMEGADLRGASLEGADLGGAKMEGADFFTARLFKCSVISTDFSGVNFASAALRSVNLTESLNLTHEQIAIAFWDGSVKMPPPPKGTTLAPWRMTLLTDAGYLSRWKGWLIAKNGYDKFGDINFPELADITPTSPDTPLDPSEILRPAE